MALSVVSASRAPEREATLQLVVLEKREEADGVVSLTLGTHDGSDLPMWEPGAHVDVVIGEGLTRQYSLCGPIDSTKGVWRIAVLREPESRGGSHAIHDSVQPGQSLVIRGPRNNFSLVPAKGYLFIAGGIGITPILSMVHRAAAAGVPWTLLYGGRTRSSMAFTEELGAVPGGELVICPQDEVGLLDLESWLREPQQGTAVYCCGPEPLLAAVEEGSSSWPQGSLHTERFVARQQPVTDDGTFEVALARSGGRLTVGPHDGILDILEGAGYEVTNSCRAGICGTCLTDVVTGEPEHLDDVLSEEERESNRVILPCVSRSKTDLLVLDL